MKNPAALMKMMGAFNTFKSNHPKFVQFVQVAFGNGVEEGTIIEVTVTKPGQSPITSNLKVQQSDLDLLDSLKNMN